MVQGRRRGGQRRGTNVTERCIHCGGTFEVVTMQAFRDGMWCLRCTLDAVEGERSGRRAVSGRPVPRGFRPREDVDKEGATGA